MEGWEPAEVTDHEYDETGRLVRSVTRREAEWDEEQAGWILALAVHRQHTHTDCGGYLPEVTDPAMESAYVAKPPIRCHVCTTRARAHKTFVDDGGSFAEALMWPVNRRE